MTSADALDDGALSRQDRFVVWLLSPRTVIVLLAFAASIVGIVNRYTYDDKFIVELNPAVHTLHHWWRLFALSYWPIAWGGDGYRPITMLAFAVQWTLGGGSPVVFHAGNILLYCAVALAVFGLASRVLPRRGAWIAAALFAVHPVHVEAVADVVGQSELWVALTSIVAVMIYLRARRLGPLRAGAIASIALLYAVGCFAKEHGVMLPGLLIAVELVLVSDDRPMLARLRELRPFYLGLLAIAVAFAGAHTLVLSNKGLGGFQPFVPFQALKLSNTDRILTMFGVVPQWLRLFYWPAHLSSEYAPPDIEIAQGFSLTQVPGLFLLLGIFGLAIALRRRRPVLAFGVAWICVTLLPSSNFLVPAGILLSERTLFLPSVGAMLIAGDLIDLAMQHARSPSIRTVIGSAVGASLLAGVAWSDVRTTVWHDNNRLFNQAVVDAPFAYRAHYMLGAWDFEPENARKSAGEREYRRALNLFPYDPFLAYNMAMQYRRNGMCGPAIALYAWAYALQSGFQIGHGEYAWCLLDQHHYAEARAQAFEAIRLGDPNPLKQLRFIITAADSGLAAAKASDSSVTAGGGGKLRHPVQKAARLAPAPLGHS